MRILRGAAALLLGLAVAVSVPSTASAVIGASISLSPTHGTAATTLTATYRYSDFQQGFHVCFPLDVDFRWNGLHLGTVPLTQDKAAAQCVARLSEQIPSGLTMRPGAYAVSVAGDNSTSATFTLEAAPAPVKTTKSPTPHPRTTTAHAEAQPTPAVLPTPTLAPSPSPEAVSSSDPVPSVSPSPSTQLLLASGAAPVSSPGPLPWLLGGIGVLVVAAGASPFFLRRRTLLAAGAPASGTAWPAADAAELAEPAAPTAEPAEPPSPAGGV